MDAYKNIEFTPELLRNSMDFAAGQPPPGVTPNFEHQDSNALVLWITCGICIPIIVLAAVGNFWTKFTSRKKALTWGDVVFIIALLGSLSWIILSLVAVDTNFFGRHMWDIKLRFLTKRIILISTLGECFWPIWFLLIKISIFAMYLELFGVKRWLRWGCYIGMALMTGFHVAAALFYAISCSPKGGVDGMAYLMGYLSKRCLGVFPIIIMQSAVNIAGDIYLIILPLPAIWSLNMPTKKKWGICAIFFTGFTGIAASACSLYYRIDLHTASDLTWLSIVPWATSVYEMTVGIVVYCMPSLTALVRRWIAPLRCANKESKNGFYSSSASGDIQKPTLSIASIFRFAKSYSKLRSSELNRARKLPLSIDSLEKEKYTSRPKHSFTSSNQTQTPTQTSSEASYPYSYPYPQPQSPINFSRPRQSFYSPDTNKPQPNPYQSQHQSQHQYEWQPLELTHLQNPNSSPVTSLVLTPGFGFQSWTDVQINNNNNNNNERSRVTQPSMQIPIHTSHIAYSATTRNTNTNTNKPKLQTQVQEYECAYETEHDEHNKF